MAHKTKVEEAKDLPPRLNRPGPVGAQTGGLAGMAFLRAGFQDPTLVLRWRDIAGPEVARLAQPVRYSPGSEGAGGTLTLRTIPGAALFLAHEKRALCARINGYLGRAAVSQLKFHQGPLVVRPPVCLPARPLKNLPPTDPSLRYQGPEGLAEALRALARRRAGEG